MPKVLYVQKDDSLAHHGILGQKWGVRRFQNKDGSLTAAGRRRYDYDIEGTKKKYESAKEQYKAYKSDKNKTYMDLAKDEYTNAKIKKKLSEETKVSSHRQKLESLYKDKGMTEEEAAIAAYKRDRTEKIVVGALATAAVATAVIVAKKQYDKNVDQFLNNGTKFHRITMDADESIESAFYAAYKQTDRMKYRGLYGNQLRGAGLFRTNDPIYDVGIEATSKIKIASPKSAKEALGSILLNDKQSADIFKSRMNEINNGGFVGIGSKHRSIFNKAEKALNKGIIDDNVYKAYNILLVDHGDMQSIHDSFFNILKSRGYGGIVDVNDKYLSGFKSKKPMILFGGGSSLRKTGASVLSDSKINRDLAGSLGMIFGENLSKPLAALGAYGGGKKLYDSYVRENSLNEQALSYRNLHPQTRKTLEEIRRMIEENRYV